jgi:acyl-CoA dehydrogenase
MVPNSLGPAELLLTYGTDAQKDHYLPRLANGTEIPCFALTGPEAGSDAASMPDSGIVCRQPFNDEADVLGIRLNWEKRYITLGPVATLLGLAFHLYDPDHLLGDKEDIGITLALIPTSTPGVEIGKRHFPMSQSFMNGPNSGRDVFIPMDWIIGGQEFVGQGWRMLMNCLSVGRAISLPALSTASGQKMSRAVGAYAAVRKQFKVPIGKFEGISEVLARIAGNAYTMNAARGFTTAAIDSGEDPSVASAIVKYQLTERMRLVVNDAMDPQPHHLRPGGNPLSPLPVQGNRGDRQQGCRCLRCRPVRTRQPRHEQYRTLPVPRHEPWPPAVITAARPARSLLPPVHAHEPCLCRHHRDDAVVTGWRTETQGIDLGASR